MICVKVWMRSLNRQNKIDAPSLVEVRKGAKYFKD